MSEIRFDDLEALRAEIRDEFAPFGGPIAHGFLSLALLPRMRGGAGVRITSHGSAASQGSGGLRFLSPVPKGAKVHARSRLAALEAKPRGTLVTSEIAVQVVGSERPALTDQSPIPYGPPRA